MSLVSEGTTRVWVKASVVDAIRNPKTPRFGRSSSMPLPSSSTVQVLRRPSFCSDTESDAGSGGTDSAFHGRNETWGWLSGNMLESSQKRGLVVRLGDELLDPQQQQQQQDSSTITLPPTALQEGDVLLDNELPLDAETGRPKCPSDLIKLTHLHEPAVVHCLRHRYAEDVIYTATGPVLLALNPFKHIRGLFGEVSMKRYWDSSSKTKLPPHVYAIADASFRSMMRSIDDAIDTITENGSCNQSILVSGESGAGKTVTTKFVMKYLAALSQKSIKTPQKRAYRLSQELQQQQKAASSPKSPASSPKQPSWALQHSNSFGSPSDPSRSTTTTNTLDASLSSATSLVGAASNSIEAKVLQSNPILESFGNARTVRNDNSSRFGKFIEIQFTNSGKLVGANIETYLLEKVRLVTQSKGERNYHVFFEVLQGMPSAELRNLFIAKTATPDDFKMTNSGTYDRRDGVKDKDTYKALRVAMNTMKMHKQEQEDIFAVTGALLHASNLSFLEVNDLECELEFTNVHLQPVCHLLGVTPEDLNEALCYFHIQAGVMESVRRSLSKPKAYKGLEALIKATYGSLFSYLVRRINDSIAYKVDPEDEEEEDVWARPAATIGVLDIFGFESFTTNSFEQLCINYCNEALQQQFNAFVLKNEQEEYEREGIEWSFIEFPENQDVLDLIDKRGSGILNILDDQCRAPGTSDRSFSSDVYGKCKGLSRFHANRKQESLQKFEILHYAGPVEYTAEGFIEKNRDELPKESTELLKASNNPFVQHLAEIITTGDSSGFGNGGNLESSGNSVSSSGTSTPYKLKRSDTSLVSRSTVGGQFRRQLKELRKKIDLTSPHYVRCLKPNDHLIPDQFDAGVVAEQLRCGGILEAVRVSRAGFTQHYPHADFVRRYRGLALRELKMKDLLGNASSSLNGNSHHNSSGPSWARGGRSNSGGSSPKSSYTGKRWGTPGQKNGTYSSSSGSSRYNSQQASPEPQAAESPNAKQQCLELLKVIYKKLVEFEKEEGKENVPEEEEEEASKPAHAKSKTYTYQASTPPPAWRTKSNGSSASSGLPPTPKTAPGKLKNFPRWARQGAENTNGTSSSSPPAPTPSPAPTPTYRSSGFRRGILSGSDLAKVGIQLGKTKVFLRHKAFEALERIRSTEQSAAATKLNSIFRMYLSRIAYLPIRDAYRYEMRQLGQAFVTEKEHKEEEASPRRSRSGRTTGTSFKNASDLIARYESQVRASIHNPIPRHKWGSQAPMKAFKWMLVDGLWSKNPSYVSPQKEEAIQV